MVASFSLSSSAGAFDPWGNLHLQTPTCQDQPFWSPADCNRPEMVISRSVTRQYVSLDEVLCKFQLMYVYNCNEGNRNNDRAAIYYSMWRWSVESSRTKQSGSWYFIQCLVPSSYNNKVQETMSGLYICWESLLITGECIINTFKDVFVHNQMHVSTKIKVSTKEWTR